MPRSPKPAAPPAPAATKPAPVGGEARVTRLDATGLIALAALLLSLGAAGVNAWFFLMGSDIKLLPPNDLLLYRDGPVDRGVLKFAVPVRVVNKAISNFGDTIISYRLSLTLKDGQTLRFSGPENAVVAVLGGTIAGAPACDLPAKCFSLGAFQLIESPVQLMDVPGSSSRETYVAFSLVQADCRARENECRFYDFGRSVRNWGQIQSWTLTIETADDGSKALTCDPPRVPTPYLSKTGVITLNAPACWPTKVVN